MSVTVYKEPNFGGAYAHLGSGVLQGRDLVGCRNGANCEEFDNAINSMRVDANTIVMFADSHALTASGGGARVVVGPAEIADLSSVGMGGRISSISIAPYRPYDRAQPPQAGVTIYNDYGRTGRRAELRRGDYSQARLASEEVKVTQIKSITVSAGVVAILYSSGTFDPAADAVMIKGPAEIDDLAILGVEDRVQSIRVLIDDSTLPSQSVLPPLQNALPPLQSPPPPRPEIIVIKQETQKKPSWVMIILIFLFLLVMAIASYTATAASKTRTDLRSAEAMLAAQAAIPLAATATML